MEKKDNILFKDLNLVLVYSIIFVMGIGIMLTMITYINHKVEQYNIEDNMPITENT